MNILKELTCKCSFLSGGGSGVDGVFPPTIETVKETSRLLADEVCCCHDVQKSPEKRSYGSNLVHVRTMQRVVKALLIKHEIIFDKSVRSIAEVSQNGVSHVDVGLRKVFSEMFKDGQVNWGRVVAVYAFAHCMANYCVLNDMQNDVKSIANVTATYVENNLSEWILNQGGWDSFEKQFHEEETTESKVWKGLLCTFVGLGTLVTITALK